MEAYLSIGIYMNYVGVALAFLTFMLSNKAISKKSINPIKRFKEDSSEEVAVKSNSFMVRIIVYSLVCMIGTTAFLITKRKVFIHIPVWFTIFFTMIDIIRVSPYICDALNSKEELMGIPENLMGITMKNLLIHLGLIYLLDKKAINYLLDLISRLIVNEQVIDIVCVTLVLCVIYQLFFSIVINSYCIIAFTFMNKNLEKVNKKICEVNLEGKKAEEELRKKTVQVNKLANEQKRVANFLMGIKYTLYNIKIYILVSKYEFLYVWYYFKRIILKSLENLINKKYFSKFYRIVRNPLVVILLIVANIYLYINYKESDPVVHFYELLSTVIIIPIFLTKITEKND